MNELNFYKIDIEDLIKLSIEKSLHHKINILKINIDEDMSYDIVNYLKEMNITAETLFPGIEGLAKSLIQSHIRT
jgi:excinuclease UvrABC helicase subunit UvrB